MDYKYDGRIHCPHCDKTEFHIIDWCTKYSIHCNHYMNFLFDVSFESENVEYLLRFLEGTHVRGQVSCHDS